MTEQLSPDFEILFEISDAQDLQTSVSREQENILGGSQVRQRRGRVQAGEAGEAGRSQFFQE